MAREILLGIRSLLFPNCCCVCEAPLEHKEPFSPICPNCLEGLPRALSPWCQKCGRSLFGLGVGVVTCLDCRRRRFSFDQAISPFRYEGGIRDILLDFKYRDRLSVAVFFGKSLAETVRQRWGTDPLDAVVPVPLHPTRLRERGFNQALGLAQILAKELHLVCLKNLILRTRWTPPQSGLSQKERFRNVRGAFQIKPDPRIRGLRILLVDDVFTTGATVDQCARLLKKAGVSQVLVVTVAHG